MLRQDVEEEDLRSEIYSLRKHITRVCGENQILKVKIRKLQDEMIRRDKMLDEFLQSKRFFGFPKNLQEKGPSVLMNLKVKNDKLEQTLLEKDMTIKRLQNTLQTAKLYNANSFNRKFASKGIECNLWNHNEQTFLKNKLKNKIELHMPKFEMGDYDYTNDAQDSMKENLPNQQNVKQAKSEFLLDINLGLKQKRVPSYHSETIFESASYHVEAKASKSDGLIEDYGEEYIPTEANRKREIEEGYRIQGLRAIEQDTCTNIAIQKILRTLEEFVKKNTDTEFKILRTVTIDECVQFPLEDSGALQIETSPSENNIHEMIRHDQFNQANENLEIVKILKKKQLSDVLDDVQVLDQSDVEAHSEREKADRMEKFDIGGDPQIFKDREKPHEEIKQLHIYLLDMISQVDSLKDTISQMKAEQEKTESDLKFKDQNIVKLAKEIEELRELRSFSSLDGTKTINHTKSYVEEAEKDNVVLNSYGIVQKTTRQNIKKIAGKLKHLKETKSKSSISSQNDKRTPRSPEKRKQLDRTKKKSDNKVKEPEIKKVIGIGNGDVIDVPFYRCGFTCSSAEKTSKNVFDELD